MSDEAPERPPRAAGMGCLTAAPHPLLLDLLYAPQFAKDREEVLPWLLRIDAAHLVMLAERGILPQETAAGLLQVNRELAARRRAGESIVEPPPVHRGLYMVYERCYVDRLGPEAGGAAHVARSRNDINATVARMRSRDGLIAVLEAGGELLATALGLARRHSATPMSGFTHFQPAQPTTFGHYLAGVASELLRSLDQLAGSVNRSPLGAGAGLGTSFPIDQELTASLFGFDGAVPNSLDAVASRDYAVQVLAALSILGITLTRLSFDLQTWGSVAYGFLRWPDHLVSTSSMMPQKRNAFVLENIRGQAVKPAGKLVAALLRMKSTPFSNSVEVGSEATSPLWPALGSARTAVQLTGLVLREVEVDAARMRGFLEGAETTMTALADHLAARHGLPFRTAHEAVGRFLQRAPSAEPPSAAAVREGLQQILDETAGGAMVLDEAEIARALDPVACIEAASHGGGPAPDAVRSQLANLERACQDLVAQVAAWRQGLERAEALLDERVEFLLREQGGAGE